MYIGGMGMKSKKNHSESIELRPLTIDDYEAVLMWSKDDFFCTANGWELNRSSEELYRWWINCVNNKAFLRGRKRMEKRIR